MASIISFTFREAVEDVHYQGTFFLASSLENRRTDGFQKAARVEHGSGSVAGRHALP
jgi:hypothetical protein